MTSLNIAKSKSLSRPWLLLSAALVLNAGGALAADRIIDPQTQARGPLSGTLAGRSAVAGKSNAVAGFGASRPGSDPQEQARRLVLGNTTSPAAVAGHGTRRVHADAQEMARRVILGTVV